MHLMTGETWGLAYSTVGARLSGRAAPGPKS